MAIDKYSGLTQTDKFYARYGKAVGKDAVARQQKHVALELIKKEAQEAAKLPNFSSQIQKPVLKLPNLKGGIYEQAIETATKPKVSEKFIDKMLKKIANDPTFNWRATDLTPEQIAAIEARLGKQAAETTLPAVVNKPNYSNVFQNAINDLSTGNKPVLPGGQKPTLPSVIGGTTGGAGATGAAGGATGGLPAAASTAGATTPNLPVPVNPAGGAGKIKKPYVKPEITITDVKPQGLWGKFTGFLKRNKKTALIAAAVTALVAGGVYLYNRNKAKEVQKANSTSNPTNDLAANPTGGQMSANGPYTVTKGDNVWNIARANLIERNKDTENYKPKDVEILKRTEEIMQLNNLHYEKDNYRVIIQPGQSLKLA